MFASIEDTATELRKIVTNAKTAMMDPMVLLNSELELDKFDKLLDVVRVSLHELHTERNTIIEKENELREELNQLRHQTNLEKATLENITRSYKPKFPKRYKVMLFSL